MKPDYKLCHGRYGGYAKDIPKPYHFMFPKCGVPRKVIVSLTRYVQHYYLKIHKEDNPIWSKDDFDNIWKWQIPWDKQNIKGITGRLFEKKYDTIKEAQDDAMKVLKGWKILNNKKYKIRDRYAYFRSKTLKQILSMGD